MELCVCAMFCDEYRQGASSIENENFAAKKRTRTIDVRNNRQYTQWTTKVHQIKDEEHSTAIRECDAQ